MKNKISERSKNATIRAINAIKSISTEYSKISNNSSLKEKDILFFQNNIYYMVENLKRVNCKRLFQDFNFFIEARNCIAPSKRKDNKISFENIIYDIYSKLPQLKKELEINLKRANSQNGNARQFEKFGSNEIAPEFERKQTIGAIEDKLNPNLSIEEQLDFPEDEYLKQAEKILESEIEENEKLLDYAKNRDGLSDSILGDISEWLLKTKSKIANSNPFLEEEFFIGNSLSFSSNDFNLEKIENLDEEYNFLPSVNPETRRSIEESSVDFDFYKKELEKEVKPKPDKNREELSNLQKEKKKQKEILLRNLKKDIEKSYIERKTKWEMEQIDKERKKFIKELYEKIARFKKLENIISPFINDFGRLWGLANTPFNDSGFELLNEYSDILENDEFLTELAKLLGRQDNEQSLFEKELRDKVEISTEYETKPAYRGEISGLKLSNDLASVIPSELALYKNPKTKKYFMLKFAQKQLLSYSYERDYPLSVEKTNQEEVEIEKTEKEEKGPILMCIDTSGSMIGAPERIAKTVAFALTKIALQDERKCYLISFSTGIETLDLSSFKGANAFSTLITFLRKSFNGGTDAVPALTESIKMLQKKDWENSDVLMISDFIMNSLPEDIENKIKAEQEKDTYFYSLVIGESSNEKALEVFDANWNYNPSDKKAQRKLVEELNIIREHKLKDKKSEIVL